MTITTHAERVLGFLLPEIRRIGIVGGGALRSHFDGTDIKDIDVFFRNYEDFAYALELALQTPGWEPLTSPSGTWDFKTPNGVVSLIGFGFGAPEDHLDRFDFRACAMVAWTDGETLHFRAAEGAIDDAATKQLFVVRNNGTDRELRRIQHYVDDYGYTLHSSQVEGLRPEEPDLFPDTLPTPATKEAPYVALARRTLLGIPITAGGY